MTLETRKPIRMLRQPETDDELWWTVYYLWSVAIPRVAVCEGHVAPFDAFANAYFAREPVSVWKASRGLAGKTFALATLVLTEAVLLGSEASLLGGSFEQSKIAHDYTVDHWDSPGAPKDRLDSEPTMRRTDLVNGGEIVVLPASTRSARGRHPQRLRADEVDEMAQFVLTSALGQPMEKHGIETQTVLSSTHHYPNKTFQYVLEQAAEKSWPVYEWCYRETLHPHGWLSEAQKERTKATVPMQMWLVEYELQEPSIEGRAFDIDKVQAMFKRELGEFEGAEGEYIEIEEPVAGATYATGADWAKEADWTVITTMRTDVRPWRCVAWERLGRRPWPDMVARFDKRVRRFPHTYNSTGLEGYQSSAAHDSTGIGNVVADLLTVDADGITMVGRGRADMFSEYIASVETDSIEYPMIRFAYDEHRYTTVDDLYGRGHPPDSVVAGSISWTRRDMKPTPIAGGTGSRRASPWKDGG